MPRTLGGRTHPGGSWRMAGLVVASLAFGAPSVSSLSVTPGDISGGSSATGTVAISRSTTPTTVALLSSNTSIVKVPSSVTVPANTASTTFQVVSGGGSAGCPSVSAVVSGSTPRSAMIFVKPVNSSSSKLSLGLSTGTAVGGGSVTGTVTLIEPIGTGKVTVQLSSSSSQATVPASVILPPGVPNEVGIAVAKANFTITTQDMGTYNCAVITATHDTERGRALLKLATISG
jgi:hypothetical protein